MATAGGRAPRPQQVGTWNQFINAGERSVCPKTTHDGWMLGPEPLGSGWEPGAPSPPNSALTSLGANVHNDTHTPDRFPQPLCLGRTEYLMARISQVFHRGGLRTAALWWVGWFCCTHEGNRGARGRSVPPKPAPTAEAF